MPGQMPVRHVLVTAFLVGICLISGSEGVVKKSRKRVVCYYTNWSVYRLGLAKFLPSNINPHLCTHLIYAFGGFNDDFELQPFDKYQDIEKGGYARFNGLKQYNKGLRTLLALGGWNEGSGRFSELVADEEYRKRFVLSVIRYLRQYNFDGLDLDWEYPGSRAGSDDADKQNYARLCEELRAAFEQESIKTNRPVLLLTMAVPAGVSTINKGFDVARLNAVVDFFNILAYDYHASSEPLTDHHAPLLAQPGASQFDYRSELNVDYTVRYYVKLGAERRKLVVGIPTYGRSYTLLDAAYHDLQAAADSPGLKGKYTKEDGYLSFYEVCEMIAVNEWQVFRPFPERMGPYATKDKQWVGYDDEFAVAKKAEYVRDNYLGGIMFWSIDNDDFRGRCSGQPYPLIEAAKKAYLKPATGSPPKQQKAPTPPPPPTPDPGADFSCKREGFYAHPRECNKYFWCLGGGPLGIVPHSFTCPTGLLFNRNTDACDFPRSVKCKIAEPKHESITFPPTKKPLTTRAPATLSSTADPLDSFYDYYDTDDLPPIGVDDLSDHSLDHVLSPVLAAGVRPTPAREVLGGSRGSVEAVRSSASSQDDSEESDPADLKQLLSLITDLGGVDGVERLLRGDGSQTLFSDKDRKALTRIVSKQQGRTTERPGFRDSSSWRKTATPAPSGGNSRRRPNVVRPSGLQNSGGRPASGDQSISRLSGTNTRRQPAVSNASRQGALNTRRRPQYTNVERIRTSAPSVAAAENSNFRPRYTSIERSRSPASKQTTSARGEQQWSQHPVNEEPGRTRASLNDQSTEQRKDGDDELGSRFADTIVRQAIHSSASDNLQATTFRPIVNGFHDEFTTSKAPPTQSTGEGFISSRPTRQPQSFVDMTSAPTSVLLNENHASQRRPSRLRIPSRNRFLSRLSSSRRKPVSSAGSIGTLPDDHNQQDESNNPRKIGRKPSQLAPRPQFTRTERPPTSSIRPPSTTILARPIGTSSSQSSPQAPANKVTGTTGARNHEIEQYSDYDYYYDYFFEYPDGSIKEIPVDLLDDYKSEIETAKKAIRSEESVENGNVRSGRRLNFSNISLSSTPLPDFFSPYTTHSSLEVAHLPDGYEVSEYKIPIDGNHHEDVLIYEDENGQRVVSTTFRPIATRNRLKNKAEDSTLRNFFNSFSSTTESPIDSSTVKSRFNTLRVDNRNQRPINVPPGSIDSSLVNLEVNGDRRRKTLVQAQPRRVRPPRLRHFSTVQKPSNPSFDTTIERTPLTDSVLPDESLDEQFNRRPVSSDTQNEPNQLENHEQKSKLQGVSKSRNKFAIVIPTASPVVLDISTRRSRPSFRSDQTFTSIGLRRNLSTTLESLSRNDPNKLVSVGTTDSAQSEFRHPSRETTKRPQRLKSQRASPVSNANQLNKPSAPSNIHANVGTPATKIGSIDTGLYPVSTTSTSDRGRARYSLNVNRNTALRKAVRQRQEHRKRIRTSSTRIANGGRSRHHVADDKVGQKDIEVVSKQNGVSNGPNEFNLRESTVSKSPSGLVSNDSNVQEQNARGQRSRSRASSRGIQSLRSRIKSIEARRRKVRKKAIVRIIEPTSNATIIIATTTASPKVTRNTITRIPRVDGVEKSRDFSTRAQYRQLLLDDQIDERSLIGPQWQDLFNHTIKKTAVFVRRKPGSVEPEIVGHGTVISRPGGERRLIVQNRPTSEITLIDSSTISSLFHTTPSPRLKASQFPYNDVFDSVSTPIPTEYSTNRLPKHNSKSGLLDNIYSVFATTSRPFTISDADLSHFENQPDEYHVNSKQFPRVNSENTQEPVRKQRWEKPTTGINGDSRKWLSLEDNDPIEHSQGSFLEQRSLGSESQIQSEQSHRERKRKELEIVSFVQSLSTSSPSVISGTKRTLLVHGQSQKKPLTTSFVAPKHEDHFSQTAIGSDRYSASLGDDQIDGAYVTANNDVICYNVGTFPHPRSNKRFIQCSAPQGGLIAGTLFVCPEGLQFDSTTAACGWPAGH